MQGTICRNGCDNLVYLVGLSSLVDENSNKLVLVLRNVFFIILYKMYKLHRGTLRFIFKHLNLCSVQDKFDTIPSSSTHEGRTQMTCPFLYMPLVMRYI